MEMNNQVLIKADPASVYAAVFDPKVLKACISGAQKVTGNPRSGYDAAVAVKAGWVDRTVHGRITMSNLVKNRALTIIGEVKGGYFAKAVADIVLEPDDRGDTTLTYAVKARVPAYFGGRMLDGFVKKTADQFFANLQKTIERQNGKEKMPSNGKTPQKTSWLEKIKGRS